jgi:integrase
MARPVTGAVIADKRRQTRRYALRFSAYGKRRFVTLGTSEEGWTATSAKQELERTLAAVRLNQWRPRVAEAVEAPPEIPTFHVFASEWWERNKRQLAQSTQADYRWRLDHLLPFFRGYALDAINADAVDRYIAAKLGAKLSPRSVNMTLILLAAILESAVERELIDRNRARGKRVKERKPARSYLENASQITAVLDAAGQLDRKAHAACKHVARRAILATLLFAGLRISELCELRWRDVDLGTGWLTVAEAKTDAGRGRRVKIRGALRDDLTELRARVRGGSDSYVFPTRSGGPSKADNLRNRVLAPAIKKANERLADRDLTPLPAKLTPHSMRRTFASVLYAIGEPPPVVMAEMGHTNPALALRVYAQSMRRDEDEKSALRALIDGGVSAANGSTCKIGGADASGRTDQNALESGVEGP